MKLSIIKAADGKPQLEELQVSDKAFAADFNEPLVHQVVVAYQAGGRSGTRAQKNRAAVRGGGRKPWAQKVPAARAPALSAARYGAAAARLSRQQPRIFRRRSTRKCTAPHYARFCRNYCAKTG